jgi:AcrR family transcriptional regulator
VDAGRLPTALRREQLADAALSILGSRGAHALTVKEIAAVVGISDGAVFRHFKDKQALFDAAVERFESFLTELPSEALAPIERLGRFVVERVAAVQARPIILALAFNDRLEQVVGPKGAVRVRKQMQESVAFIVRCIVQAQGSGELDAQLAPDVMGWMITGAMRGAARAGADPEQLWIDLHRALFLKPSGRTRR